MIFAKVSNLKGGEIVAKSIKDRNSKIILEANTIIKAEYINIIKELGIENIFIKYEETELEERNIIPFKKFDEYTNAIKEIIELHTYKNYFNVKKLKDTSEDIYYYIKKNYISSDIYSDIYVDREGIYEHLVEVAVINACICINLEIDKKSIIDIIIGSLIHDLGLRYISVKYNNVNVEDLTPTEIMEFKKHTIYGYSVIENIEEINEQVKNIVLYHHEKIDKTGYPLKKSKLNQLEKIISLTDEISRNKVGIGIERKEVSEIMDNIEQSTSNDLEILEIFKKIFAL